MYRQSEIALETMELLGLMKEQHTTESILFASERNSEFAVNHLNKALESQDHRAHCSNHSHWTTDFLQAIQNATGATFRAIRPFVAAGVLPALTKCLHANKVHPREHEAAAACCAQILQYPFLTKDSDIKDYSNLIKGSVELLFSESHSD